MKFQLLMISALLLNSCQGDVKVNFDEPTFIPESERRTPAIDSKKEAELPRPNLKLFEQLVSVSMKHVLVENILYEFQKQTSCKFLIVNKKATTYVDFNCEDLTVREAVTKLIHLNYIRSWTVYYDNPDPDTLYIRIRQ